MNEKEILSTVLKVVDQKCSTPTCLDDRKEYNQVVYFAQKNGLYYKFVTGVTSGSSQIHNLDTEQWTITSERIGDCKQTIEFLDGVCNRYGIDFVLIKLFNTIQHVPNDIDIFVNRNDRKRLIHALEENGMEPLYSSVTETKLEGDYVKTDIYTQVRHLGMDFLDDDLVWSSKTQNEFFGVEYPALNSNADLLMLIPHHILVHKRMTLLDFLHLRNRIREADTAWCRDYAYERGWGRLFDLMLDHVSSLEQKIYEENEYVEFPYVFDTRFVLRCISESNGPNVNYYNKPFLYMSFYLQDLMYRTEGTYPYRFLRSVPLARRTVNSISSLLKVLRGDRKSSN